MTWPPNIDALDIITLLPTKQSCPICELVITIVLLNICVGFSLLVDLCIETYSLIILLFNILTEVFMSVLNFKSCGSDPITT